MRLSRLRKFKSNSKKYIKFAKFPLMFYVTILCLSSLISGTNGLYKDDATNSSSLRASWQETWDKSSLKFWKVDLLHDSETLSKEKQDEVYKEHYAFSCDKGFTADIYNDGNSMKGKSTFFVRYSAKTDINKNKPGEIIFKDDIQVIESEKLFTLQYEPEEEIKPGYYKFSALQRPLHPGGTENESKEYEGRFEIWGEVSVYVTQDDINGCKQSSDSSQSKTTTEPDVNENSEKEETPSEQPIKKEKDKKLKTNESNEKQNQISESNESSKANIQEGSEEQPSDSSGTQAPTDTTENQEGETP
jgi:YqxM protein